MKFDRLLLARVPGERQHIVRDVADLHLREDPALAEGGHLSAGAPRLRIVRPDAVLNRLLDGVERAAP